MNTQIPEAESESESESATLDWTHELPEGEASARAAIEHRTLSHGTPSRTVLGTPFARWIPMDVHTMMDYANALVVGSGALATDCREARVASIVLATLGAGRASLTDYRLGIAKVIPIEAHHVGDYVWGAAAIAAPFVFGYWQRAPRVALVHVIAGATSILGSLVTDFRAYRNRMPRLRER